jgi:large subunit ribosomal protein L15
MTPYSINFLHDNIGATRNVKQLGRGPGNGKGKTSGRGHKGQLARQGGHVHVKFEGGQTPITRRLPKYGRVFKNRPQ